MRERTGRTVRSQRRLMKGADVQQHRNEVWKAYIGPYEVSDQGRVRHSRTGRILKPCIKHKRYGYHEVTLIVEGRRSTRTVHRAVLETFMGLRGEGEVCRHGDGDPANNALSNLSWGTPKQNADDRARHGRTAKGTLLPFAKLTPTLVRQIRRASGRQNDIAAQFGVSISTISHVQNGHCWSWVE